MAEPNVQESTISIQVGDEIQGQAQNFFQFNVTISKQAALKQKEDLKGIFENDDDVDYAFVVALSAKNQHELQKVEDAIKNTFQQKADNENIVVDTQLYEFASNGTINYKTVQKHGKVYLAIKPQDDMIAQLQEMVNSFLGENNEILENQTNKIELSLKQNRSFQEVLEKVFSGEEGVGFAFFQQASAQFKLSLNNDLFEQVENIVNQIDPEIMSNPLFLALKFAQNFEIALKYSSASELPKSFQKLFMTPPHLRKLAEHIPPEEQKSDQPEAKYLLGKLLSIIEEEFSIFITVPDIAAINIEATAPYIGKLAKKIHKSVEMENPQQLQNNQYANSILDQLS